MTVTSAHLHCLLILPLISTKLLCFHSAKDNMLLSALKISSDSPNHLKVSGHCPKPVVTLYSMSKHLYDKEVNSTTSHSKPPGIIFLQMRAVICAGVSLSIINSHNEQHSTSDNNDDSFKASLNQN